MFSVSFTMRTLRQAVSSLVASICVLTSAQALDPHKSIAQYGHNIWLRQNGLPANAVDAALQTSNGYLWFGTSAGLFRFDGVRFNESIGDAESDKIHESISSLCESRDSSLWIGTMYNGLRRLKHGKVYHYGLHEGFYDTQVLELCEGRDKRLWIGTSVGLYSFHNGKFSPVLLNPNYITGIAQDALGRIWVGTHDGLRIFDDSSSPHMKSLRVQDGLRHNVVTFVYADRHGNVWIGTVDGLSRWRNGTISNFTVADGLSNNHVNDILEDRDGNLWVGTQGGLNRYSDGKWTAYTESDGLTDNNVRSIAEDHEGSLWVCTTDGLNQFEDASLTTYTVYDGLSNDHISSILEAPDRSLYFLSDQGSSVIHVTNGKKVRYDLPVGPAYIAKNGSLWIGQSGAMYNIKNDVVKRYDTASGLPAKWISAITEDDQSLIMYIDHTGIFRFVNNKLKPFVIGTNTQYPAKEYVVCFYPQPGGIFWIGTADSLVKVQDGTMTSFKTAQGLAGNWVSSIYDDKQGSLWISSPQGGLSRYRDGKFTAYNSKSGLFSEEIYCVLGDDQGDLWLSSQCGIGHVRRKELDEFADGRIDAVHCRVYVAADGMKTDECFGSWQPAGWKAHDGILWFATKKGAVRIDPKNLRENTLIPTVLIERVITDLKPIVPDQFATLSPGTEKLEFHYTALSYLVPDRVRFKYRLDGFDRNFVDAGTRRVAYYTNLSHGQYRFRVLACNNDGVWNETGASFAFELLPHFYQSVWFSSLVVIVLVGAIYGLFRFRLWRHIKREEALEIRVHEAVANIKMLSGLIPICANCKKIRNDKGFWDQMEAYIQTHSEAKFSHGICPDCAKKLYPDAFPSDEND